MAPKARVLMAVGDVAPYRDDPESIFDPVRDLINNADLAFCQFEINLSRRGTRMPQARLTVQADKKTAAAVKNAGFDVVSWASNHCMDWGRESFFDTIDALEAQDLKVIGAGENLAAARRPAVMDIDGARVAFLAYCSILPQNYWAEKDRPGCVPMRAFTRYEQIEHDQPGTPCRIHSFPLRGDLEAMIDDIRKAKAQADIVIVSHHWGIHFTPAVLADYQRDVGHAAIDAGADMILGHHAHILKGIEVYKGKAIFYSLGNFALDVPLSPDFLKSERFKETQTLHPDWEIDPEYPTFGFPADARKTFIVRCVIADRKISQVAFLPAMINKQSQPEVLVSGDPRFEEVVDYVKEITTAENLDAEFSLDGDQVVILT